jgi:hypothetical protein
MESSIILLGVFQALNLLIYRWVGVVFISQPRFNHPHIFHKPIARLLLSYGPLAVMTSLVILAFVFTESPWLFLGLTVAGFIAFAAKPHPSFFE